ncbi:MAG: RNA methyltransferase [Polyangiaceae bacterium]|nr:RNA methyltransferase [Polyangiaceae bacterium]
MSRRPADAERPEGAPPRLVVGVQPVREALRAHGAAVQVWLASSTSPRLAALERWARDLGATARRADARELDRVARGTEHQGVVAWAPDLRLATLDAVLDAPAALALALDGVQDPQNFGAAVRCAVGIAGAAIVWPESSSAPLGPATFRASAGAIEHAALCRVRSLAHAAREAADRGHTVVALVPSAPRLLLEVDLTGPALLLLGGEHEGLHPAVRRAATVEASLVATQGVQSLNVSVAAALALYEAIRQRRSAPAPAPPAG